MTNFLKCVVLYNNAYVSGYKYVNVNDFNEVYASRVHTSHRKNDLTMAARMVAVVRTDNASSKSLYYAIEESPERIGTALNVPIEDIANQLLELEVKN